MSLISKLVISCKCSSLFPAPQRCGLSDCLLIFTVTLWFTGNTYEPGAVFHPGAFVSSIRHRHTRDGSCGGCHSHHLSDSARFIYDVSSSYERQCRTVYWESFICLQRNTPETLQFLLFNVCNIQLNFMKL